MTFTHTWIWSICLLVRRQITQIIFKNPQRDILPHLIFYKHRPHCSPLVGVFLLPWWPMCKCAQKAAEYLMNIVVVWFVQLPSVKGALFAFSRNEKVFRVIKFKSSERLYGYTVRGKVTDGEQASHVLGWPWRRRKQGLIEPQWRIYWWFLVCCSERNKQIHWVHNDA